MNMTTVQHQTPAPASLQPDRRNRNVHIKGGQLTVHIILIIVALVALLPMVWCVFASFKGFRELVSSGDLLPHVWTVHSYNVVFGLSSIWTGFRNTAIVTCTVTVVAVFTSALEGYVFAKFDFPFKGSLFVALLSTMMVPFIVVLIPLFLILKDFTLVNTLAGVIVTGLFSTFGIFMLRQFMFNIPSELIDSGRIDGASEWRIFGQLIMPLSSSPMAALGIFIFLGTWNDFLWPSVVLTSSDQQTLPVVINGLQGLFWTQYDYLITAAVVTLVPLMICYLLGSRYMIEGIAMTGMKL